MEKAMTVEERIRRAEEIYNRRNAGDYLYNRKEKRKKSSFTKKMIKKIVLCFAIYGIFYTISNKEYIMSEEFQSKIQELISQNEVLEKYYENIKEYIENNLLRKEDEHNLENNEIMETEKKEELKETESEKENEETDLNIGGSDEEKTQEEMDVDEIKKKISFINPISGTITSTFGWRTPTTKTVPKYHTGLDIAAKSGTIIKSATDGKIILKSSKGDFGNHYKIEIDDVIIIYAHCSKLYLDEGNEVKQGQEIAEVGSTGNSTRGSSPF